MLLFELDNKGPFVYHATFTDYIHPIINKGLVPMSSPSNWVKAGQEGRYQQDNPGIYAFESALDAFRWAFHMQWEHKQPASVVQLKDTGTWADDPSDDMMLQTGQGRALYSKQSIPASAVVAVQHFDDFDAPVNKSMEAHPWVTG
jgi:hypothetical protein